MFKSLLVPALGNDADEPALNAAAAIARGFAAHIDALHVRLDAAEMAVAMAADTSGAGSAISAGLIDDLEKNIREREQRAKQTFSRFCAAQGLTVSDAAGSGSGQPSAALRLETGQEERWVSSYAMTADLTVCGRGADDASAATRALLEAVLMDSGRPLLIPDGAKPFALPENIAIAWKATPQAARAVAAALPLLKRAKQVAVITVEERDADHGEGERLLTYFGRHGVKPAVERVAPAPTGAPETLLAAASRQRADLLVMGGYGHGRLREWIFGGFTQHMLSAAPLPVLIAH